MMPSKTKKPSTDEESTQVLDSDMPDLEDTDDDSTTGSTGTKTNTSRSKKNATQLDTTKQDHTNPDRDDNVSANPIKERIRTRSTRIAPEPTQTNLSVPDEFKPKEDHANSDRNDNVSTNPKRQRNPKRSNWKAPGPTASTGLSVPHGFKHKGIHDCAKIFPKMSEREYEALENDIINTGLKHPIIIHRDSWRILDGRHRLKVCEAKKIKPMFEFWGGTGDPLDFVLSQNLARRHLTKTSRALAAANFATLKRGQKNKNKDSSENQMSVKDAAQKFDVGSASINRAKKILKDGIEELQKAVINESINLSEGYIIAGCSSIEEQKQKLHKKLNKEKKKGTPKFTIVKAKRNFAKYFKQCEKLQEGPVEALATSITDSLDKTQLEKLIKKLDDLSKRSTEDSSQAEKPYPSDEDSSILIL